MSDRLTWMIDGVDFSQHIHKRGYSVTYEPRYGSNGGTMLDGSETVDILAWKTVLELPINGLPQNEMSALIAASRKGYISISYFDLHANAIRENVQFIPNIGTATLDLMTPDGRQWYSGLTLQLRER